MYAKTKVLQCSCQPKRNLCKKKTYFSRSDDFSGNLLELEMEILKFCFVHHPIELDSNFLSFLLSLDIQIPSEKVS